jgi:hypothetical protein
MRHVLTVAPRAGHAEQPSLRLVDEGQVRRLDPEQRGGRVDDRLECGVLVSQLGDVGAQTTKAGKPVGVPAEGFQVAAVILRALNRRPPRFP